MKDFSYRELILFSLPSIFSSLLEPLASIVDNALIGRMSTSWLASLALALALLNSITWMFNFLVHGPTQAVSDHEAQNNPELLAKRVKVSLVLALIVGVLCSLFLTFFQDQLFAVAGGSTELRENFDQYFNVRVYGHTFLILGVTTLSILRGLGRVKASFWLTMLTTGANIILTSLFLFVFEMGIMGAALGTILSGILGLIISTILIFQDERIKQNFFKVQMDKNNILRFGKNSLNLLGRSGMLSITFFVSTKVAANVGTTELATHQILLSSWLFVSFFLDGLAITGNIWGARLYGKGDFQNLSLCFKRLLLMGGVLGLVFTVIYYFFDQSILNIFTNDQSVIQAGLQIWWLIVFAQIISAIAFVYDGLIFGLEGFDFLRTHMIIGVLVIVVPQMYYAYEAKQLFWIWSALVTLNFYRAASGFYYVRKKVFHVVRS
ncbi:MAG: MATE family efflux transporter [Oligoflexia bacterium]|nr:MATE family efflux transporter [Oligoflexia bacterium]